MEAQRGAGLRTPGQIAADVIVRHIVRAAAVGTPLAPCPIVVGAPAPAVPGKDRTAILSQIGRKALANPELTLVPVALLGMLVVGRFGRRRSPADDLILPDVVMPGPAESEHITTAGIAVETAR